MKNTSIILILIFFSLAYSCKEPEVLVDSSSKITFNYVNNTDYDINLSVFSNDTLVKEYKIEPNDTLKRIDIGWPAPPAFRYFDGVNSIKGDSIYLTFSDQRYMTFNVADGIFVVNDYESVKTNEYTFDCFYYFENADFEKAKPITE